MEPILEILEERPSGRLHVWTKPAAGLRAFLVIDDTTLGPGAGGTRTRAYPGPAAAVRDAADLARAMTLKCALAGLPAGGAKLVVMDHRGLDRPAAFRALGRRIEELAGLFLTAGDLGTRLEDLQHMAEATAFARTDDRDLAEATAAGLVSCLRACAQLRGRDLAELRVAIQGCGAIGAAVAEQLAALGARLVVADVDAAAVKRVVERTGAASVSAENILTEDVDIIAPCAIGGVITAGVVARLRAWAVCGAANNLLASPAMADLLLEREVVLVPDFIASAGGVIHGVCNMMGLPDSRARIHGLGKTAHEVIAASGASGRSTVEVARQLAEARLGQARDR